MSRRKGIVLESGQDWALVLFEGGIYKRIKNHSGLQVGEAITESVFSIPVKYLVIAAVFIMVVLTSMDFFTVKAYARISSGVELGFNRWERVVYVRPYNQYGNDLLKGVALQGKKAEEALQIVINRSLKQPVPAEPHDPLTLTVYTKSKSISEDDRQQMINQISDGVKIDENKVHVKDFKGGKLLIIDADIPAIEAPKANGNSARSQPPKAKEGRDLPRKVNGNTNKDRKTVPATGNDQVKNRKDNSMDGKRYIEKSKSLGDREENDKSKGGSSTSQSEGKPVFKENPSDKNPNKSPNNDQKVQPDKIKKDIDKSDQGINNGKKNKPAVSGDKKAEKNKPKGGAGSKQRKA
ncbi:anti-sigma-I factor RsgI family protein [Syntrophomonas erecta]